MYFPYDENLTCSGNVISGAVVLAAQNLSNTSSFAKKANISVSKSGNTLKNVLGYIKFSLPELTEGSGAHNIKKIEFIPGTEGEYFSGTGSVDFSGSVPVFAYTAAGDTSTIFRVKGATGNNPNYDPSDGYLCVPPGDYHGLSIAVTYKDNSTRHKSSTNTLTIARSKYTDIGPIAFASISWDPAPEVDVPEYSESDFETAAEAVENMYVGMNINNAFDAHGDQCVDHSTYDCDGDTVMGYETGWGSGRITWHMIEMLRNAGFNAIRVPVTWYPHMDDNGTIDEEWLDRIEEVVKWITVNADMYCILNSHFDAGSHAKRWLIASYDAYNGGMKTRFKNMWTNIANRLEPYGPKLIFEGYNEIIDQSGRWGSSDEEGYTVINNLAQDFVDAVRATGGNNLYRNLVVNTYSGGGSAELCTLLTMPTDLSYASGTHIMKGIHSYRPKTFTKSAGSGGVNEDVLSDEGIQEINTVLAQVRAALGDYACIISEFGASYKHNNHERARHAAAYVRAARKNKMAPILWQGVMDPTDRTECVWSSVEIKDSLTFRNR